MQAEELLREGRLHDALTRLQEQVRQAPAEAKLRVFLFQLLCVIGDWDRALKQLNVAAELDSKENMLLARAYRQAIAAEHHRREVFAGGRTPLILGEPPAWVGLMVQAAHLLGGGRSAESATLRAEALEQAPAIAGTLDGTPFAWVADADSRLGPIVESLLDGKYYWVPFMRIARLHVEEPTDLRDLVWAPAHFTWTNGGESFGFIPTRYVGSESSEEDAVRLARTTEWVDRGHEAFVGVGQRMWATETSEHPLLEVRHVVLDHQESEQAAPSPAGPPPSP